MIKIADFNGNFLACPEVTSLCFGQYVSCKDFLDNLIGQLILCKDFLDKLILDLVAVKRLGHSKLPGKHHLQGRCTEIRRKTWIEINFTEAVRHRYAGRDQFTARHIYVKEVSIDDFSCL